MSEVHNEMEVYSVENVIIKNKSMKQSLLSTTESVPGSLRINKVTSSTSDMSADEQLSATDYISKTIEIFQILLNSGIKGLEAKKPETERTKQWLKGLNSLAGLTEMFKGIVTITTASDNDPMANKLRLLRSEVDKLGVQIGKHIKRMEIKMAEINFFRQVIGPALVLLRYFKDCVKRPGRASTLNFKKAYEMHRPVELTYTLMSALQYKDTNPIRIELDRQTDKRNQSFQKWESMISRLLGYFIVIEFAAIGYLGIDSKNFDLILKKSTDIMSYVEKLRKEYHAEADYWPKIEEFLVNKIKNEKIVTAELANGIQHELAKYKTTDAFYVFVSRDSRRDHQFNVFCQSDGDQILTTEAMDDNPTKTFVLIYRNHEIHKKTEEDFSKLYADLEACRGTVFIPGDNGFKPMLEEKLKVDLLEKYGLVSLFFTNMRAEQARFVNFPKHFDRMKSSIDVHIFVKGIDRNYPALLHAVF